MKWLQVFVLRPVATSLACLALVLAGLFSYVFLPVAPLPQIDFPMILVSASMPGASPETMASSVATPLEQSLGAISGLREMSSRSAQGSMRITLMFDMDRDINSAARDVQAAINASRAMLPSSLRGNPTYHKVNPSSVPIMVLAVTSRTAGRGQMYDLASTVVAQKLSQVPGVGEVEVGGGSLPAVRISLNPYALYNAGVALDEVRSALAGANTMRPNGAVHNDVYNWQISSGRQLTRAEQYEPLIVAWRDGSPIRLRDVARVEDSVEDLYQIGFFNDQQGVQLIVRRQADANIIETVDAIREQLPMLEAMMPADVSLTVAMDRTPSIRGSLHEAELTLVIAVLLVVMVVLAFLRNGRVALIPAVAVPVSLIATFSLMLWLGYTLNTISLMALIVATGFVVDDAIVVLENIMRHIEKGMSPLRASLRGLREVGFTVLAMSVSLVAVFIPMLLMGDLIGRLFREFAVTLSVAVMISLLVSLTLTPMMCAQFLRRQAHRPARVGLLRRGVEALGRRGMAAYRRSLSWSLNHGRIMMLLLLATVGLNVYLYAVVPKGLLPQQDTGQLLGFFRADEGTSFQAMMPRLEHFRTLLLQDPAIDTVAGFAGGRGGSTSSMLLVQLKPRDERDAGSREVIERMRPILQSQPGARLFLVPRQDIFLGGGQGSLAGEYEYSLKAGELSLIKTWMPRVREALAGLPELVDVENDLEDRSQQIELVIDRDAATRLGVDMRMIAATLNNAFSQRQVSVIYGPLNQYHVVMGVDERFALDESALRQVQVITADGARVPLSAFSRFETSTTPSRVRHQGLFAAESFSFALAPGVSLGEATRAIDEAVALIGLPAHEIQAGFEGEGELLQQSLQQQPWLILGALLTMYIVLGMLYESYIHPVTILSTLPSAGVGALLMLILAGQQFTLIALIGIFLLIGIVKKNAIMMVDFALTAQRRGGLSSRDAIYQACLARLRPIMMTTAAALCGALPLLFDTGVGTEMRQPLGLTIVGGLLLSQVLTLYTTPVVYLYLDRFAQRARRRREMRKAGSRPFGVEHGSE